MVKKGDRVLLIIDNSYFKITTFGEVKEEGRRGDWVKLMNISSKKEVSRPGGGFPYGPGGILKKESQRMKKNIQIALLIGALAVGVVGCVTTSPTAKMEPVQRHGDLRLCGGRRKDPCGRRSTR